MFQPNEVEYPLTYSGKKKILLRYGRDVIRFFGWPKPITVPLISREEIERGGIIKMDDEKYTFELPTAKL
jgi:hypothetical protein